MSSRAYETHMGAGTAGKYQYFEDFQVGEQGLTNARTVGEATIVAFAGVTLDFSSVHLDRHMMAAFPSGERIAHGLLGPTLVTGMLSLDAPHTVGRGVPEAFFRSFEVNYPRIIALGDTIKVAWRVNEKEDDPEQAGFGIVVTTFDVLNQDNVAVYNGTLTTKVRKKSAAGETLQLRPGKAWEVKEFVVDPDKVYYLEDNVVGEGGMTFSRTITEADIVNFAALSGDFNPLHVDAVFAKESVFGERIAHGMLVFCSAFGLWVRDATFLKKRIGGRLDVMGHLGDGCTFLAPVKIGDTIRCQYMVTSCRVSRTKPDRGILTIGFQVLNQKDEVVAEGRSITMQGTMASEQ